MFRRLAVVAAAVLAMGGVTLVYSQSAHAATYVLVDDDGQGLGTNCDATGAVPTSIQTAINLVDPGGTVKVCPGVYNGPITINKPLTLVGAQATVPTAGRTPGGPNESVIQGNVAFPEGLVLIKADNVSVNGFTVQNNTLGPGISVVGGVNNAKVQYNIVTNNVFGVYANGNNTSVQFNRIFGNNLAGPANGNGIYVDQGATFGKITNNTISDQQNAGIIYIDDACAPVPAVSDIQIASNTISNVAPGSFIAFFGGTNITIQNNTLTNAVADPNGNSGVFLATVETALVQYNTITRANFSGIAVRDACGPATGVRLQYNNISFSGGNGIDVTAGVSGAVRSVFNTLTSNQQNGILYGPLTNGNTIQSNTARTNGAFDCRDESVGALTAGTANLWQGNRGNKSSPAGICTP